MNIRSKLTIKFILIFAVINLVASVAIYIFSADYRREEFYDRLMSKANATAKLLIEVDEVDINVLRRIETNNPVSLRNEKIIIHDFRDEIIFTTDEQNIIKIDSALLDRIRLEGEVRVTQGNYEVLGFLFKGEFDRFVVVAAATDTYGWRKLQNLRTVLLFVFGINVIIVSITGWLFARDALEPISRVVQQVDEISISSLNLRVDEGNGKDEIATLAHTFNKMLQRLETSFITQKDFIANASHELRTPLTAITGQLEVALLNVRTLQEYRQVIGSVLEDIKNLSELSNRLLLLAQATSLANEKRQQCLRIDELIWEIKDDFGKQNPSCHINIDFSGELDDESLIIRGDAGLVKVALSNVIENSCKYSRNHTCNIVINANRFGLTIRFSDEGIGIPEDDLNNIFEPFYRGNNTGSVKGYGIGLSMVKRIVYAHKGTISVHSEVNKGTTFSLAFPLALKT